MARPRVVSRAHVQAQRRSSGGWGGQSWARGSVWPPQMGDRYIRTGGPTVVLAPSAPSRRRCISFSRCPLHKPLLCRNVVQQSPQGGLNALFLAVSQTGEPGKSWWARGGMPGNGGACGLGTALSLCVLWTQVPPPWGPVRSALHTWPHLRGPGCRGLVGRAEGWRRMAFCRPRGAWAGTSGSSPFLPDRKGRGCGEEDKRGATGLGGVRESPCLSASPSPSLTWGSIVRLTGWLDAAKQWCSPCGCGA